MKPTLVVLAAGIGSRYGGDKQIDGVGPSKEILLEYAIADAVGAGFDHVVLVLRESMIKLFEEQYVPRLPSTIRISLVSQPLTTEIDGVGMVNRTRPWGTAHALLIAGQCISTPFCVINADDFYGRDVFVRLYEFLTERAAPGRAAMVAFALSKTLSSHGPVARGICDVDVHGSLQRIREHTGLLRRGADIVDIHDADAGHLSADAAVSMNCWGFHPSILEGLKSRFRKFVQLNSQADDAEWYLPALVGEMVNSNELEVEVLRTSNHWFGMTYPQDRQALCDALQDMVDRGLYQNPLWAR